MKVTLSNYRQVCGGGRCPKFLVNDNGDVLVQGTKVERSSVSGLNVPPYEDVVFIPKDVLAEFLAKVK